MLLKWDDSLMTGIEIIDNQHKELLNKINDLVNQLEKDNSNDVFLEAIKFMKMYALEHFETEQSYFETLDYPMLQEHLDEHKKFIAKIQELEEKSQTFGNAIHLSIELNAYLIHWWYSHIKYYDKALAMFINSKKKGI